MKSNFELKDLGTYRVERTEDYPDCPFDKSYCELIRVKGSKPERFAEIPSHLYKYSETELALYLKDRKMFWPKLGSILGIDIDTTDNEIIAVFPVDKFSEVSRVIPFVKKRGKTDLSESEKKERISRLRLHRKPSRKIEQKEPNSDVSQSSQLITLDIWEGGKKQ